jgi:hypothetical protein
MSFGIFFTDASFDYKTHVSSIGITNITNNKEYSKITKANNPTDAEKQGIEETIQIAILEKIYNLVIIADSKFGINSKRKEYYGGKLNDLREKEGINLNIQFLWLPRRFNFLADYLSKNITEETVEEFRQLKQENMNDYKKNLEEVHVNDINLSMNASNDLLSLRLKQFKILSKDFELSLNSFLFNEALKDNPNIEDILINIMETEELEEINRDQEIIKNKDKMLYLLSKSIEELSIFI